MKKIEAYKTNDGLIFETEDEAIYHEISYSCLANSIYTKAEQKVYDMVVNGLSNKEIAINLDLQEVTIKKHIGKMFIKSGVTSRIALVVQHYKN